MGKLIDADEFVEWLMSDAITDEQRKFAEQVKYAADRMKPAQPGCEDAVPRTSVEYICRKNTVSTNPYEHKYHDKFIQFMDDPEISDFGRWQHSNGFNTALVAVKCDLDKVQSVTPKQPGLIPVTERLPDVRQWVLCQCRAGIMDVLRLTADGSWSKNYPHTEYISGFVVAWMPLPPKWEGGQDGV